MVAKRPYVPDAGDLVWLAFDPARGHEQQGLRPALVLSPKIYNAKSGLMLACPVTSRAKGYPFEVPFSAKKVTGVILADQVRAVDWKERRVRKIAAAPAGVVAEARRYLARLIGMQE
jgi:mRNA interferase MazF